MSLPIIMDCDPGIDDAFSLAMAVASSKLEVLGITTTYGNVGLSHTTTNALRVLDWLGADIPVYRGVDRVKDAKIIRFGDTTSDHDALASTVDFEE